MCLCVQFVSFSLKMAYVQFPLRRKAVGQEVIDRIDLCSTLSNNSSPFCFLAIWMRYPLQLSLLCFSFSLLFPFVYDCVFLSNIFSTTSFIIILSLASSHVDFSYYLDIFKLRWATISLFVRCYCQRYYDY